MDLNTALSSASSLASLILFGLEIYKITTNKKKPKGIDNTSSISFNNDSHDKNINIYKDIKIYKNNDSTSTISNSSSNDFGIFIVFFIVIGFILSKFYLDNRSSIVFWIIILGILSFAATVTCILILAKNKLITNWTLYIQTIKWFPLFIGIIFIYNPLYNSSSLDIVAELIRKGTGYGNILFKYPYEFLFFLFQVLGLAAMAIVFIGYLTSTIKTMIKSLKTNVPAKNTSKKDVITYITILFFIFVFVSGLYVKFFNMISKTI
ncbi:hypothetical protein SAMN05444401_1750 [Clostridium amylolyticum]|uniref:Uncharacterized protein n=1 Tax=Clostridium amylolyticum TaxID=1121298 RepID=A0A1M6EZD5_9CLOT|nr:hypothetical protein [Clostridium amylolyticum]SHI90807.1 hypothetical protein SAMN05444401_1750 [Clostridium amylolyticum]